jgi:hypothetical protein
MINEEALQAATMCLLGSTHVPSTDIDWIAAREYKVSEWRNRMRIAIERYLADASDRPSVSPTDEQVDGLLKRIAELNHEHFMGAPRKLVQNKMRQAVREFSALDRSSIEPVAWILESPSGAKMPTMLKGDMLHFLQEGYKITELVPLGPPSYAQLYAALRNMHWSDKKLAVVEAKDLKLGVQTYSGDMLDAAIERYVKEGS